MLNKIFRPDDPRLPCIVAGAFYADCCQTMMNWFPAVGVTCSPSDGPMGNMCAIAYTTGNMLMPMVLAQANEMAQANGNEGDESERKGAIVEDRQQWGTMPPLNFMQQGQWCEAKRYDNPS